VNRVKIEEEGFRSADPAWFMMIDIAMQDFLWPMKIFDLKK
jgi:hypothetical protein